MGLLDVDQKLDAKMSALTEDDESADVGFEALRADEPADEYEEAQHVVGMKTLTELLSGDESLPKIANVFHQDRRPLMMVIPDLLEPILLKVHGDIQETGGDVEGSVFFGEGGLMQEGVDMLFELAQTLDIPGSDDPDQYTGALIGIYKKAGEHVLATNDGESMKEAIDLGGDLIAEGEGMPGDVIGAGKKMKKRELSAGVQKGLLS